ncbi:class A sortase [Bacillus cereus]|nr:class A sortase [Bacillus cereus]
MNGIVCRKKKKHKKIYMYVSVLLVGAGMLSLGYPFVKDSLVSYIAESKMKEINTSHRTEGKEKVTYHFEDVTPITMKDIVKAANKKMPVTATIKVPSVGINLPVIEGVSNSAMSVGAGTLKPNQEIGKGNYAMASHHMNNPKLLFSPLERVKNGASIYLSNGKETYKYVVVEKRIIDAREVEVIEEKEGKNMVTLITCNTNGKKRLLVVGELRE